jgi:hypothetical protein
MTAQLNPRFLGALVAGVIGPAAAQEKGDSKKPNIGSMAYYDWFSYEFWRFVFVQQEVAKAAETMIEFPPMQKGASFNMEAVKAQIIKAVEADHRQ